MKVKEEQICRLCLTVAENDFQIIDENARKIFEVLSLRVNLDISKDPVICKDCAEVTEKCFNFKSACVNAEEFVFSYVVDKNDNFICRFCSNYLNGSNFLLLDTLMNDVTFAVMLQQLMPEMNFDIIKTPIICTTCKQDLECYIKFMENCWDVEQKITKYLQNAGTPSSAQVKLSEIQRLLFKNNLKDDLDYTRMREIKQEVKLEDIGEANYKEYDGKLIKTEEIDIKGEEVNANETACETPSESVHKYDMQMEFEGEVKDIGEAHMLKCTMCTYETKWKGFLKRHMSVHNNIKKVEMYKCPMCTYETKQTGHLKTHMLIHKDVTEVEMHKCSICTYETKHKSTLKKHIIIHKDMAEVETHKCTLCTYETRRKGNLKNHMLIHKDITEVETYKCTLCTFETKHKGSLNKHMLIHKDVTEMEMYKCTMCSYQTKRKHHLKGHVILVHKDFTEVETYKCSSCTFETKRKENLKNHMLTHKDVTEVEMYKCTMCTFQTKHRYSIKGHMKLHKGITQMELYKCSKCNCKSKHKAWIKRHRCKALKSCDNSATRNVSI